MHIKPYTDTELDDLRSMPKRVTNPGARWSEKPKARPGHHQRIFQAYGQEDQQDRFSIYMRQNLSDESGFSCGISYLPRGGQSLTLARYNGPSHEHGEIVYRPHIHRATEKTIATGKKPESAAEETTPLRDSRRRHGEPCRGISTCTDSERDPTRRGCSSDARPRRTQETVVRTLCEDVRVDQRPDGALMLRTHFEFPDGDRYPIHLSEAASGGLRLSDRGHTLMHISYEHDVDAVMDGTRGTLMERIMGESGLQWEGGAFLPRHQPRTAAGGHIQLRTGFDQGLRPYAAVPFKRWLYILRRPGRSNLKLG